MGHTGLMGLIGIGTGEEVFTSIPIYVKNEPYIRPENLQKSVKSFALCGLAEVETGSVITDDVRYFKGQCQRPDLVTT